MLYNLTGDIGNLKSLVIDNTLTNNGEAADAAATGEAINAVQKNVDAHTERESNPHKVTKAQVGLSNVDNTADADKPISNAVFDALEKKVDKIDGKSLSENDFTNDLKEKLDGLENYTLPVGGDALGGVKNGGDITIDAEGKMTLTANRATVEYYTATIPAEGWTGDAAPYTNAVTVNGITADDRPDIDIVHSDDYSVAEMDIPQWGYIYRAVTSANTVTFYATNKPTVALNVQIKAVR